MTPLDLVGAAPWKRVAFTTYSLSLSFFEAVVLDALVRAGANRTTIFSDPTGVQAALSEQGARRVGREYELEPVAANKGCFHPKVGVFIGEDCHLLVGSGNLTFGGWGANFELIEHLHPSFAPDAFRDAAAFFSSLANRQQVRMAASDEAGVLADALLRAVPIGPTSGNIRLLHSLGGSVADGIVQFADELGGAERITVMAPFFDKTGAGLGRLCNALGCDAVHLHAHPSAVAGSQHGLNWPQSCPVIVNPVMIDTPFGSEDRPLHAKAFEIVCKRGRLVVSGSPNGSLAALYGPNVEVAVVRIERERAVGWNLRPAPPPSFDSGALESEESGASQVGVLRATIDGEHISGTVICPRMSGSATLTCDIGGDDVHVAEILIDEDGGFTSAAPDLEGLTWGAARLVAHVQQGENIAGGFVSIRGVVEVMRRAGPMASRLLAMLAGSETPADVAAILSWFKEDVGRLGAQLGPSGTASESAAKERPEVFVPLSALQEVKSAQEVPQPVTGNAGQFAWQRALRMVIRAFERVSGPWEEETDEDATDSGETPAQRHQRIKQVEKDKQNANDRMTDLLDAMLDPSHAGQFARTALALAHYVADRNRPSKELVSKWIDRIVDAAGMLDPSDDRDFLSVALLRFGSTQHPNPANARRYLLARGVDPDALRVEALFPAFWQIVDAPFDPEAFLADVREVKMPSEQVAAFLQAVRSGVVSTGYPTIASSPHWSDLKRAFTDPSRMDRWCIETQMPTACGRCHMSFSASAVQDLRSYGVTRCCSMILCEAAG